MKQGNAGESLLFLFDDYWWMLFMIIFLALLLSAFTHRKKPHCQGDKVLRHDIPARVSHWFNAFGILILLFSGFMLGFLFFPRLIPFTDGAQLMFNLHFIGALLFLFGAVYWVGNTFLYPQRLEEHAPYIGSLKDAIIHYARMAGITKKSERPPGKYDASERLAFVPLTLLALFMGLTGLIKVSARVWHVPDGLLHFSTWTHDWSTLLLAVLLVFHIILAAVVPWAWPLFRSMIHGYVNVDFIKSHHPGWYKELEKEGLCPSKDASPKEKTVEQKTEDKVSKKGEDHAV
jgi:formate dehydrogenase subunit gamma